MSSVLASGLYISDSQVETLSLRSISVLSNVIQRILDKYTGKVHMIHQDVVGFTDPKQAPLFGNVIGLSLGNGKVSIIDGRGLQENVRGVPGMIELLYETDALGERIPLSAIQSISRKRRVATPIKSIQPDTGLIQIANQTVAIPA